jgi:AcrR family transcriptional regulator
MAVRTVQGGGDPAPAVAVGRRERNKLEKRARIVAAARQLFAEKGFQQTTTQELAEAADIGTGTLFLYVRSKEDLLVLVFKDEMLERALAAFEGLPREAPLLDQLMSAFTAMMEYHARDRDLARILLKEVMFPGNDSPSSAVRDLMEVIYGGLGQLLEQAKGRELRPDFEVRLVAETLFGSYFMDLLEWLRSHRTKTWFDASLRRHLAVLIDGLRLPGGA